MTVGSEPEEEDEWARILRLVPPPGRENFIAAPPSRLDDILTFGCLGLLLIGWLIGSGVALALSWPR